MRPKLYQDKMDNELYESITKAVEGGGPKHTDGTPMSKEEFFYYARGLATMTTCSHFLKPWKDGKDYARIANTPEYEKYRNDNRTIMENVEFIDQYIQENGKKDANAEEIVKLIKEAIEHCNPKKRDEFDEI